MQINAVIVDDEQHCRFNLSASIATLDNWIVIAEYNNALDLLQADLTNVDVIFLDIAMPKMSGMEAAKKIANLDSPPLIIFVTAFEEYAIDAFEICALDYLLKPFDNERFKHCAARIVGALQNIDSYRANMDVLMKNEYMHRIVIKSMSSIKVIDTDDVHFLKASGNYVEIKHNEGNDLLRSSLSKLKEYLDPSEFCQIHRGYITRQSMVKELVTLDDGKHLVKLKTSERLPVGENFKDAFLDTWLK